MAFEPDINYVAVLVSFAAAFVLGGVWYNPKVFGTLWMRLEGISMEEKSMGGAAMARLYGLQALGLLVMAIVFAHVLEAFYAAGVPRTLVQGLAGAGWTWIGFLVPVHLGHTLWGGKPWGSLAINAGYHLVALLIMGAILTLWH